MVTTKTMMAATADHQIRAAMTGSPTNSQAPTARVSVPLALRSANASASRITRNIVPHFVERYDADDRSVTWSSTRTRARAPREAGRQAAQRLVSSGGAAGLGAAARRARVGRRRAV